MNKIKAAWAWLKNELITYPVAIAGAFGAVLAYAVSQGVVDWSQDQVAVIGGTVTAGLALISGVLTHHFAVTLVTAVGNAVGALILGFSTSLGAQHVATWLAILTFGLGLISTGFQSPKYGKGPYALAERRSLPRRGPNGQFAAGE